MRVFREHRVVVAPAIAVALLLGVAVLRFALPDPVGIMLLAVLPITALGMMFGRQVALAAALFATAVFVAWAADQGDLATIDYVNQPLTFFVIGFVSGTWAHGALGGYDLRHAAELRRLRRAIAGGGISYEYQPIVAVSDGRLVALEALARWSHPKRGRITASEFVPLAEGDPETIWALTLQTVSAVAADVQAWSGLENAYVSVNIAPATISRLELPARITAAWTDGGLTPRRLGIEVTESAVAEGEPAVIGALEVLREGVAGIAIDDFGTGHSSLSRLDRLPVNTLKLDLPLVQRVVMPETRAIARAIVEMAHALGMSVVAEGVEDEHTRELLAELGCDAIQGHLISRPLPADRVPEFVRAR